MVLHHLPQLGSLLRDVWAVGYAHVSRLVGDSGFYATPPSDFQVDQIPRGFCDLAADILALHSQLSLARSSVDTAADHCRTFAPHFVADLCPEIASWPSLELCKIFESGARYLQHFLTRAVELGIYCECFLHPPSLADAASAVDWAASLSCIGPEGGLWLDQPPEDAETTMSNDQFAVALRLRWGLSLWPLTPSPWPCACAYCGHHGGTSADPSIRALSCHLGGYVYRRRDALTREILRIGTESRCSPSGRDPTFRILGVPTGGLRDDDAVDGVFWRGFFSGFFVGHLPACLALSACCWVPIMRSISSIASFSPPPPPVSFFAATTISTVFF